MYYKINVSRAGQHLFATRDESLTNRAKAQQLYFEMARKFPDCEVSLTYCETIGKLLAETGPLKQSSPLPDVPELSEDSEQALTMIESEGDSMAAVVVWLVSMLDNWHRNPAIHGSTETEERVSMAHALLTEAAYLIRDVEVATAEEDA